MKKNNLKKDYFWNTIGATFYSINALLFLVIVTRINGLEMAGYFSFGYVISSIFFTIASYGGRNYQITDYQNEFSEKEYVSFKISTSLITIILAILFSLIYIDNQTKLLIILLLIIEKCVESISDVFYGIMQKRNNLFLVGKSMLIKSVLSLALFFLINYFLNNLVLSLIAYVFVNLFVLLIFDIRKSNYEINIKDIKLTNTKVFKKCFAYFILVFLVNYVYNIPRYVLDYNLDANYQGIFGIIVMPISVLLLFVQFIIQPKIVEISHYYKKDFYQFIKTIKKILIFVLASSLIALVIVYLLGVPLLNLISNIDLNQFRYELVICFTGGIFYSIVFILINPLTIMRKGKEQIIIYIVNGVLSFVLSIILVNYFSFFGATISYFLTMFLLFITYILYYNRLIKKMKQDFLNKNNRNGDDTNKDILFIGGIFPKEEEEEIIKKSKGFIQFSANNFQWNIIKGLDQIQRVPIKIINAMFVGDFPFTYSKLFIKKREFSHTENAKDINVGFLNIWGLKTFFKYWKMRLPIKEWCQTGIQSKKVVITYSMTNTSLYAIKYIKKLNPNIHTCLIVTDLPQYMNTSKKVSIIYKIIKKMEINSINKHMKYVNSYVLVTKHMAQSLKLKDNYVVIEGISNYVKINNCEEKKPKRIVYAGTLNERYGIMNLINAFMMIEDRNLHLDICGSGDSEKAIIDLLNKDKRIKFHGHLTQSQTMKLINEASVLVNPRQNNEEFTKYSFPGKNLEYLSTGIPFVAYKLDGNPDEYSNYIYYVDGNSVEKLRDKIIETLNLKPEEIAKRKKLIQNEIVIKKNYINQTKKIIELIDKVEENGDVLS